MTCTAQDTGQRDYSMRKPLSLQERGRGEVKMRELPVSRFAIGSSQSKRVFSFGVSVRQGEGGTQANRLIHLTIKPGGCQALPNPIYSSNARSASSAL